MGNRGMGSGGTGNMEGMFTINDKSMNMQRIDETVRLGDTEIWAITNEADMAHPFHIHDIQFQILDRNGQAPVAGEAGWKDTVLVLPGRGDEDESRRRRQLTVALSFCRLLGLGCPKQAFAKIATPRVKMDFWR
jgi:FtsP/CotA-like multicopper oxidase with cupredoxin domain